jgi:hypothetical protein
MPSLAQYDENIDMYTIYFYRVNGRPAGRPAPEIIVHGDTTITFGWENGTGFEPVFVTPFNSTLIDAAVILNDSLLWTGIEASSAEAVNLHRGYYEVKMTASDFMWVGEPPVETLFESGFSQPLYLVVQNKNARIPVRLQVIR